MAGCHRLLLSERKWNHAASTVWVFESYSLRNDLNDMRPVFSSDQSNYHISVITGVLNREDVFCSLELGTRCLNPAVTVPSSYLRLHTQCMHMSTSIRVSDETKEKLARLKREDESWDEFLDRLANEGSGMKAGAWKGTDKAEKAREAIERSRESYEQ